MSVEDATGYRAMVARCNFLGSDRPDLQFAAKEASRWAARLAKYLTCENNGLLHLFPVGAGDGIIHAFSDSGWAGCLRTCRSTSGGVQCIRTKCRMPTRKTIALSSAEVELYAATRATSEAKGLK